MPKETLALGIGLLITGAGATLASASYTVREGDTLSKIADRLQVSAHALREANGLGKRPRLRPGTKLTIPHRKGERVASSHKAAEHRAGDTYTVRSGENDWAIANHAGIRLSVLHRLNPDVRWGSLQPGAHLRLPSGMAVAAKAPRLRSRFAIVTGDAVTVRRHQGVGAEKVCSVEGGTHVAVLARDGGWYKLRFPKGTEGWVRGDLLKTAEAPHAVAVHHAHHQHAIESHVERVTYTAALHRRPSRAQRIAHWEKHRENVQARYARRFGRGHRVIVAPLSAGRAGGDLIARAETFRGVRYEWGHASRSGTDCSGFTTQVFGGAGVRLPRTSQEQARIGQGIDRHNLSKGDLVFFHTGRGHRVTHVGIYMGSGKFIHASSGGGKVQVNDLSEGYYANRFVTGRRVAHKGK